MKKKPTDRLMRRMYALLLAMTLIAYALVNLCVILAGNRFNLSLDLTENRLYDLSALTGEVCSSLTEPARICVVSAEEDYPDMLSEMLSRYTRLNPLISVEYVDPYENPVFLEYYAQSGLTLEQRDMLVEGSRRVKTVAYDELLLTDSSGNMTGVDLEQQITSALLYVNSDAMPEAVFMTGHNERPTTALRHLLESNSFACRDTALLTGGVEGASLVIVAAPTQDYAPEEIAVLEAYLNEGGKLMAFIEPGVSALPNLEDFLKEWGITAENDLVFEPTASAAGNPLNLIPMYAGHAINTYFADHPVYVVMPSSRSLTLNLGAEAVLYTTGSAYRKQSVQYTTARREEDDKTGRAVLAAISEKRMPNGETAAVFAAGSRMIFADDLMQATTYGNSLFLSQVLSYLYTGTRTLSIPPKTLASSPLPVTQTQTIALGGVLAGVIPLCILLSGLRIIRRRKRL